MYIELHQVADGDARVYMVLFAPSPPASFLAGVGCASAQCSEYASRTHFAWLSGAIDRLVPEAEDGTVTESRVNCGDSNDRIGLLTTKYSRTPSRGVRFRCRICT